MASKQINGSAVTATSTRNRGGVVRAGGNAAASGLLTNKLPGEISRAFGSTIVANSVVGKALTAGTLAYRVGGVIRKVTTSISGVANTILRSGASDYGRMRSIHKVEAQRASFLSGYSWAVDANGMVVYTPTVAAAGANAGWWSQATDADGTSSSDDAAVPTRTAPGELVYRTGKRLPVQADYSAKTGG